MNEAYTLYNKLCKLLIKQAIVTQMQCDMIARKGTRKEWYYKRHIIDLCEFVLEQKEISPELTGLLERSIVWCKKSDLT